MQEELYPYLDKHAFPSLILNFWGDLHAFIVLTSLSEVSRRCFKKKLSWTGCRYKQGKKQKKEGKIKLRPRSLTV